jgi:hypothetical protein
MAGLIVQIGATTQDLQRALNEANTQIQAWTRQSLREMETGGRRARQSVDGLGEGLRMFAREQQSEARAARFFVAELAAIVPVSAEVRGALSNVLGAFIGGGAIGLAVAAVQTLAQAWRAVGEEAAQAAAESATVLEGFEKSLSEIRVLEAELGGTSATRAKAEERKAELLRDEDKIKKEIEATDKRLADLAALRAAATAELLPTLLAEEQPIRAEQERLLARLLQVRLDLQAMSLELAVSEREEAERANKAARDRLDTENERISRMVTRLKGGAGVGRGGPMQGELAPIGPEGSVTIGAMSPSAIGPLDPTILRDAHQATEALTRQAEEVRRGWVDAGQSIGQAFGAAFAGIMSGQMSVGQAMRQILASVIQTVLTVATKQVTANAFVAGSEAAKSQAGIPGIGPALAVAAMSAMISTVLALVSSLPSARGGWRVPTDTIASVHAGEHVLPASIARRYERNAPERVGHGGDVRVYAMDGASTRRALRRNRGELARALRELRLDRRGT